MQYSEELAEVLATLSFYERKGRWVHVMQILCRYMTFAHFMSAQRDYCYASWWARVHDNTGADMQTELSAVYGSWFTERSSAEYCATRDARMGAFLRKAGCSGDLALMTTMSELELVAAWFDDGLTARAHLQLAQVYWARRQYAHAAHHYTHARQLTLHSGAHVFFSQLADPALGEQLWDMELLSVTDPVFMYALEHAPDMSLEAKYQYWCHVTEPVTLAMHEHGQL
jgi:hypothetical protein